ncbi:alpha/beta hydrolase [Pseudonocardia sp. ICBG1293]|uniref:alpha/beta hydrolase n=1 Tax=Pseudonocardia sp. ICBG1293 TaxID=2844382 RepID=UPI001CCC92C7|nr:alpha/beta hydrolase [Pseudonocardia sp. ICBG1293]
MSRLPRLRSLLALAALVGLAAGCVAAPATGADRARGTPPELSPFYGQELAFGPCADYAITDKDRALFPHDGLECARLRVPLDYEDPGGRTAELGVLRVPARGEPIGSLVVNPGGPASPGMAHAALLTTLPGYARIGERFDLVGFDMRGTGASTPTVDCFTDDERRQDRLVASFFFGGETWSEAETARVARRCADGSGGAEVIGHLGSRDTARDMDVLRAALGDDRLNFLGASYGTRLGAVYGEMFPERVRTMVLDGGIDPNLRIQERMVQQFAGFQRSFDAMAADCATRRGCPLGDDPARATTRFHELVRPLVDDPVSVGPERRLTYRGAVEAVLFSLYQQEAWPTITDGLTALSEGRGGPLLAARDAAHDIQADGSYSTFLEGAFATHCNDRERQSPEQETAMRGRMLAAAPFMDDGRGTPARDVCEAWPSAPTLGAPYATDIPGLPRTLVVSVTGDPAAPHEGGIALAGTLRAALLTVQGERHGAVLVAANPCIDDAVADYLIDAEAPADARCTL